MISLKYPPRIELGWQERAACKGMSGKLFFGLRDSNAGRLSKEQEEAEKERVRQAKAVCQDCPVRRQCYRHAMEQPEPWGIWGGLTADQRRFQQRRRNNARKRKARRLAR